MIIFNFIIPKKYLLILYKVKGFIILKKQFKYLKFLKIFYVFLLVASLLSCVSIRFPESIKVDITVPENLDIEKGGEIDALRGVNLKENKIDGF